MPARRPPTNRAVTVLAVTAIVLVAGVISLIGEGGSGTPSPPGQVHVSGPPRARMLRPGDEIPSFSAPALGGGHLDWSSYTGHAVVLALWASWCPHCQSELPILAKVAEDFPGVDLVTVTSAVGREPGPTPAEFMNDHGLTFPVAVDDERGTLARALGLEYFPTLYFVSSDGTVARAVYGDTPEATLRTLFEALH
jgi:peroxiredoxin